MSNPYYTHGSFPSTGSAATSASMRAELDLITAGFDKLPTLSGNANKFVVINSTGTGMTATSTLPAFTATDTDFLVQDNADNSRKFRFEASGISASTTRVFTMPDANTTLVGTDATQTLTNKTLTLPVIAQISNTGTLTLPTSTDTLVGRATTDTLANKTLTAPVIATIVNTGTLTLPTSTDTLVGRATTDTLTNKTISGASNTLTNIGNGSLTNSAVTIGSTSLSLGGTMTSLSGVTISGSSNTLTNIANASLTNSSITVGGTSISLGATATTVTGLTLTSSAFNGTVGATTPSTGAFTTLSTSGAATLASGTVNGAAIVNISDSQTLTNKTISGSANTLSNIANASLVNSGLTIGSTNIALGDTATTLAGLSSVTSTSFVGALTGAASLNVLKAGDTMTGNLTINNGTDSRVLLQVSGTTQGQIQSTATAVRFASNNTTTLALSTNGVDRQTIDSNGNFVFGGVSLSGSFTFRGTNTGDLVVFESTDASATAAPDVVLYRNSASPAANDQLGVLIWRGKDSGGADQQYARIGAEIIDPTATSEDADLWFETTVAGAAVERMRLNAAGLTLASNTSLTLNAGTANGVAYLNGSKVLTTGSALTFDGTTFIATGAARVKAVSSGDQIRIEPGAAGSGVSLLSRNAADNDLTPMLSYGSYHTWYVSGGARAMDLGTVGLSIGTTDTYGRLSIQRYSGAPQSTLAIGDFATIASDVGIYMRTTSTAGISWPSGGALKLYRGGPGTSEVAQFDSNGRFALGTSAVSAEGIMTIGSLTSTDKNGIVMNRGAAGAVSATQVGIANLLNGIGTGEALLMRSPNGFLWQNNDGTTEWMRLIGTSGNLLLGTTTSVSKLTVNGDAVFGQISPLTRFTAIGNTGIPTIRYDDNGYGNILMQNLGITGSNQGFRLSAQFSNDGTNNYDAGYIGFLTESTYTSTASTRDSCITLATVLDGTMSEKVRVTSKGRVGVNTQSPGSLLEVIGASAVDTTGADGAWTVRLRDTAATAAAGTGSSLLFQGIKSTGGGVGNYAAVAGLKENGTSGNEDGYLAFFTVPNATGLITERGRFTSDGLFGVNMTPNLTQLEVKQNTTYAFGINNSGGTRNYSWRIDSGASDALVLGTRTSSTDLLWITTGGNLLVGTSDNSTANKLVTTSTIGFVAGSSIPQINYYSSASTIEYVNRNSGGSKTFSWYYQASGAGSPATLSTSGVWTNASDSRGKENIADLGHGLGAVMALKSRQFDVKSDGTHRIGFVAQELLEVLPEVVHVTMTDKQGEDWYGVDYGAITSVLGKAIQEQQVLIESLKARLDAANL